jgi:hypothetical protein
MWRIRQPVAAASCHPEIRAFAAALRRDGSAVQAASSPPWRRATTTGRDPTGPSPFGRRCPAASRFTPADGSCDTIASGASFYEYERAAA